MIFFPVSSVGGEARARSLINARGKWPASAQDAGWQLIVKADTGAPGSGEQAGAGGPNLGCLLTCLDAPDDVALGRPLNVK